MINKTPKKLITFSDRNIEMMEAIAEQTGWKNASEIVRRGVEELYFKFFPAYRTGISTKGAPSEEAAIKNAEIKAKAKVAGKKVEAEEKFAKKIDMCENMLGGEVIENAGGFKFCKFKQYSFTSDSDLEIPIAQVDPIVAETSLFVPSREAIFKHRPEVKKLFDKLNKENDKENI